MTALSANRLALLASGSVECVYELESIVWRSAGEKEVRELESGRLILGIEIQDRAQSRH